MRQVRSQGRNRKRVVVMNGLKAQLYLAQGNTLGNDDTHTPGALKGQLHLAQGNTLGNDDPHPWRPVRAAT